MAKPRHEVQEIRCDTVQELFEYINPISGRILKPREYIFRGQPNAKLRLVPSAHRQEGNITAAAYWGKRDITPKEQIEYEKKLVSAFLEGCDRSGLTVPGDTESVRHLLSGGIGTEKVPEWPTREFHEVLAFSQHHGVPTCLLDWTRNPYVAAYFAAASALAPLTDEDESANGELAIWALSKNCNEIEVISPRGGVSPYLAAQSGVLTISRVSSAYEFFIEEAIDQRPDGLSGPESPFNLQCFKLPNAKAPDVLEGCATLGITASTLFPGYEGIARNVRDWARARHKGAGPINDSIRYLLA
ncbi:FRG domain-containing protein [Alloalcanivorax xenomutans]|jgi:hypothetical protein|uniref:FRG domain-containing protein n=1 Tax=Alloalcanivorax xenomutans TaxID=1094342 RepID=UPI000E26736A